VMIIQVIKKGQRLNRLIGVDQSLITNCNTKLNNIDL